MSAEPTPPTPWLCETPWEALGQIIREKVVVAGRTFVMSRPAASDHMLDHQAVAAGFQADEYLPYWTELWPAGRMLAKAVMRETWAPGTRVLEIGCGLGLPGIAALARGCHVTFHDCDATALRLAADNARLNGFEDFETFQFDWRFPPDGLQAPVVLGSDLVYELRNINPLVNLLKRILPHDGFCLMTDQDRLPAYNLREALDGEGFTYTTRLVRAGEPGGRRVKGTLYRITRAG